MAQVDPLVHLGSRVSRALSEPRVLRAIREPGVLMVNRVPRDQLDQQVQKVKVGHLDRSDNRVHLDH